MKKVKTESWIGDLTATYHSTGGTNNEELAKIVALTRLLKSKTPSQPGMSGLSSDACYLEMVVENPVLAYKLYTAR